MSNPYDSQIAAAQRDVERARARLIQVLTFAVIARDGTACAYCKVETVVTQKPCSRQRTLDHLYPVSRGGKDELENVVISCRSCNSAKGTSLRYGVGL